MYPQDEPLGQIDIWSDFRSGWHLVRFTSQDDASGQVDICQTSGQVDIWSDVPPKDEALGQVDIWSDFSLVNMYPHIIANQNLS